MATRSKGSFHFFIFWISFYVATSDCIAKNTVTVEINELAARKGIALPSYKERKTFFGGEFGINSVSLNPKNFQSPLNLETYDQSYGKPISILEATLGVRLNTKIGSIALGGGYGNGTLTKGSLDTYRSLNLTSRRVMASIYLDSFFDEPYLVPYATMGTYNMLYTQGIGAANPQNKQTDPANYMQIGVLIQLNSIDEKSFYDGYFNWGVENTFFDIYSISYQKSPLQTDPDFTCSAIGAGLKVEF